MLLCLAAGAVSRMSLVLFTLFVSIDFWYRLFLLFIVCGFLFLYFALKFCVKHFAHLVDFSIGSVFFFWCIFSRSNDAAFLLLLPLGDSVVNIFWILFYVFLPCQLESKYMKQALSILSLCFLIFGGSFFFFFLKNTEFCAVLLVALATLDFLVNLFALRYCCYRWW